MNPPAPTPSSRTIRVFVSSTFSDMKIERDVLQSDVFPRIRQFCLNNGLRFQAIDLRWGVPEEAGRDNRTMRICLRELRRCQSGGPKPNFLILLGDRYGWRPLPEAIPAELFLRLKETVPADLFVRVGEQERPLRDLLEWREDQPATAQGWYRPDENAVPPVYELRPRGDEVDWQDKVEKPLLAALERATRKLGLDSDGSDIAIGSSATEQEIIHGALRVDDAADHVHAFVRTIVNLPEPPLPDFADLQPDGTPGKQAGSRLANLKDRIAAKIGAGNVHAYSASLCGGAVDKASLAEFRVKTYAALRGVIEKQIAQLREESAAEREETAHRVFGEERCRGFLGRAEPLREIQEYLRSGSRTPLVVSGPAGSGKSAFMAEAARQARLAYGDEAILARFIGATPGSPDIVSLLRDVVGAVRKRYPALPPKKDEEIPASIQPLTMVFQEALGRATPGRPLILFLDALDQLSSPDSARELLWLPASLPENARLVVSCALPAAGLHPATPAAGSDPRMQVRNALGQRLGESPQIVLTPLSVADGEALLARWLAVNGRTLQQTQSDAVLASFAKEGNPLWLRAAVSECGNLPAWAPPPQFASSTAGLLRQVLVRLSAEAEHGAVLLACTLGYLACARHGLAEDEVIDLLSADTEVMEDFRRRSPTERLKSEAERIKALPAAVWVRFHGDVAPYLSERDMQGARLFGFYHRSFLEAVEAQCLPDSQRRLATHQRLAAYFEEREWFLAPASEDPSVPPRKAKVEDPPNGRKASELPWHLYCVADVSDQGRTNTKVWDPLTAKLCDLLFVEAKARSGLIYELQEDYRLALAALPETQAQLAEEKRRQKRVARWTNEIIAYSRKWSERRDRLARGEAVDEPEPQLPEPAPACRMWSEDEINVECQRIIEHPTRLDQLRAFAGFVEQESFPLLEFGARPGLAVQHAYNHVPAGPVHIGAEQRLASIAAAVLLRVWPPRSVYNPRPALLRTLEGHREQVMSVSMTPDGRRAVSASEDGTVRVWDLDTGACLRTLAGHGAGITSVSVTPDGRRAVSANKDGTLQVWDLEMGACVGVLQEHTDLVSSVSVTPDGRRAVSGSSQYLKMWDLETGACLRTLGRHSHRVTSVSVTPDGRRAVSGSFDRTVRVWDLETGVCLDTLKGHMRPVMSVSVTPDGRRAASGTSYNTRVWDLETGACLCALEQHGDLDWVQSVGMTPDGRRVVSGSSDQTLRVWDLETGACLDTLKGDNDKVRSVRVTPDARRAASVDDSELRLWGLETGACVRTLEGHGGKVRSVSVTPDGRRAVSASDDKTVRVWDLEAGACLHTMEGHNRRVESLSVTPDGRRAVSAANWDETLRVWDLETGEHLCTLEGHADRVFDVSVTPDSQRAVSGSDDKTVRVWDLETGACLHTMEGNGCGVRSVSVTPDGRRAVSASERGTVRVWDLETGACLRTLEDGLFWTVRVMPDGRRAVSASLDNALRVWDLDTGACLRTMEGHSGSVWSVSVTPDGRRAVSGSDDKTVRVWDLETGACLHTLEGHGARVMSVRVTPDGRRAVSVSDDKTVRVWDLEAGACLHALGGARIESLSMAADSRRAVSANADKTLWVWDLETGACLAYARGDAPWTVAAAVGASRLVAGTSAGAVALFEVRGVTRGVD